MTVEVLEASTDRLPTEASFRFTLRPLLEATSLSLDSNRPRFGRVGQNIVVRNGLSPFGLIYMHAIRLPEDFLLARIASQILFSPHPPTPLCAVRCTAHAACWRMAQWRASPSLMSQHVDTRVNSELSNSRLNCVSEEELRSCLKHTPSLGEAVADKIILERRERGQVGGCSWIMTNSRAVHVLDFAVRLLVHAGT